MGSTLPQTMKALRYEKPESHAVVDVPLPTLRDNDVLVCCLKNICPQAN